MSAQLSIKRVPESISSWIEDESYHRRVSKREFLLKILEDARTRQPAPDLFDFAKKQLHVGPTPDQLPFRFIDLFAGIGGFRIGLEAVGGQCVFTSEWDKFSQKTYSEWFGEMPHGDITKIRPEEIPDHDILAAGFPCQPFSIAGVSKKNSLGREHGFKDKTQGTLFFNVASIIETKRPPVIILENVKNLLSHDKKNTWRVIRETLEELDYTVFCQVIDAAKWVPQHRERVFIVGFDKKVFGPNPGFSFPSDKKNTDSPVFADILDKSVPDKYTLTDHLWKYLQDYANRHKAKGNGFGFGMADPNGVSRTLSARYYKDGSEVLIAQKGKNPRRLTPREAARLMGFPEDKQIVVSDTQAYKQFGNSVSPKVVEALGSQIIETFHQLFVSTSGACLIKGKTYQAA
ncbi:MAG: DNA (cytosine-5-)-methyltransferase [Verrucomicrobiales bacterium]|nr:DNA (cytosine-5-)-methyltransferase [Verrucomicrobiales bacterium]